MPLAFMGSISTCFLYYHYSTALHSLHSNYPVNMGRFSNHSRHCLYYCQST